MMGKGRLRGEFRPAVGPCGKIREHVQMSIAVWHFNCCLEQLLPG